jgi:hypothetical protein
MRLQKLALLWVLQEDKEEKKEQGKNTKKKKLRREEVQKLESPRSLVEKSPILFEDPDQ